MMKRALDSVNEKILAAVQRRDPNLVITNHLPRLVAVSKLKPISSIIEAYEYGQRFFGENYIQELETKSNSEEILEKCPEIKFHFIGHLQSNKVNKLLKVRNLHMIETVDSEKLANAINKAIDRYKSGGKLSGDEQADGQFQLGFDKLKVMIQVNTSEEDQKSGIQPEKAPGLAEHIVKNCQWLQLAGIMTIGSLEESHQAGGPNKDFSRLYQIREKISYHIGLKPEELELSMGMSSDFEAAISMGSSNIRVGSMIFGERPPKPSTAT